MTRSLSTPFPARRRALTLLPTVSQDDLLEFDEDPEEEENPESWVQIHPRHCSRLVSLQVLYEVDLMGHAAEEALAWSLGVFPTNVDVLEFAWKLVSGVLGNIEFLDEQIRVYAPAWPVDQLSIMDRNLLRVAIFELTIDTTTPPRAVVNEAVESAKLLGSESSPRFVNGVLGSIMDMA